MRTFAVYHHTVKGYKAVKQGFSWPGFFFTWIWACTKDMGGVAGLVLLAQFVLIPLLASSSHPFPKSLAVAAPLVIVLVVGFKGNGWWRERLVEKGYELAETLQAESPTSAISRVVKMKTDRSESQNLGRMGRHRYCQRCGKPIPEAARFCQFCGQATSGEKGREEDTPKGSAGYKPKSDGPAGSDESEIAA